MTPQLTHEVLAQLRHLQRLGDAGAIRILLAAVREAKA
jgi:hypothetical protein